MPDITVLNTTAQLSGRTLLTAEGTFTVTGPLTFDRDPSAPFLVTASSAVVVNLDSDKLDGQEGSYYTNATNIDAGTVPTARLGSGSASSSTFLRGDQTWASPTTTAAVGNRTPNARLTLTSGTAVTTADVTAAGTIYYTPFEGNEVQLFDGAAWQQHLLSELSISVLAATDTNHDIFIDYNGGSPQLTLVAWTNDTTRATALTTQDGVLVLTGDTQQRYIGTYRSTGTANQTEDSEAKRFLWNAYNRRPRLMRVHEATNAWGYNTDTWRQANGSTANQLAYVVGLDEDSVQADVSVDTIVSSTSIRSVGIGLDSATVPSSLVGSAEGSLRNHLTGHYRGYPGIGYHFLAWLERGSGVSGTTWYGDNGGTKTQGGIQGMVLG